MNQKPTDATSDNEPKELNALLHHHQTSVSVDEHASFRDGLLSAMSDRFDEIDYEVAGGPNQHRKSSEVDRLLGILDELDRKGGRK